MAEVSSPRKIITLADYREVARGHPTQPTITPAFAMLYRLAREFETLRRDELRLSRFAVIENPDEGMFSLNYYVENRPVLIGQYFVNAAEAKDCAVTASVFETDPYNQLTGGRTFQRTLLLSIASDSFSGKARDLMFEWAGEVSGRCRVMSKRVELMRGQHASRDPARHYALGFPPVV